MSRLADYDRKSREHRSQRLIISFNPVRTWPVTRTHPVCQKWQSVTGYQGVLCTRKVIREGSRGYDLYGVKDWFTVANWMYTWYASQVPSIKYAVLVMLTSGSNFQILALGHKQPLYNENWSPGSQITSKSCAKIQKNSRSSREIPSNKELKSRSESSQDRVAVTKSWKDVLILVTLDQSEQKSGH